MTLTELRALCERATRLLDEKGDPTAEHAFLNHKLETCPHARCRFYAIRDDLVALSAEVVQRLPALIEVAEAARTVGTFDDFGDPEALCPECSPAHPQPFMDARMALHAAIARLDEVK